jgi:hypothetical protein
MPSSCRWLGRPAVVAGQHDDLDAGVGQGLRPPCVGARLVAHGDGAGERIRRRQHGHGLALVVQRSDLGGLLGGQRRAFAAALGQPKKTSAAPTVP